MKNALIWVLLGVSLISCGKLKINDWADEKSTDGSTWVLLKFFVDKARSKEDCQRATRENLQRLTPERRMGIGSSAQLQCVNGVDLYFYAYVKKETAGFYEWYSPDRGSLPTLNGQLYGSGIYSSGPAGYEASVRFVDGDDGTYAAVSLATKDSDIQRMRFLVDKNVSMSSCQRATRDNLKRLQPEHTHQPDWVPKSIKDVFLRPGNLAQLSCLPTSEGDMALYFDAFINRSLPGYYEWTTDDDDSFPTLNGRTYKTGSLFQSPEDLTGRVSFFTREKKTHAGVWVDSKNHRLMRFLVDRGVTQESCAKATRDNLKSLSRENKMKIGSEARLVCEKMSEGDYALIFEAVVDKTKPGFYEWFSKDKGSLPTLNGLLYGSANLISPSEEVDGVARFVDGEDGTYAAVTMTTPTSAIQRLRFLVDRDVNGKECQKATVDNLQRLKPESKMGTGYRAQLTCVPTGEGGWALFFDAHIDQTKPGFYEWFSYDRGSFPTLKGLRYGSAEYFSGPSYIEGVVRFVDGDDGTYASVTFTRND